MPRRITASLIRDAIPAADRAKLNKNDLFTIEMALVRHLLHVSSYRDYSRETKPFIKTAIAKQIRNTAMADFAVIVQLKCALLRALRNKENDSDKLKAIFKSFGLSNHARLIDGLRRDRVYSKAVAKAKEAQIEFANTREISNTCAEILQSIDEYLRKFSYRKLRFIATSNNMKLDDLVADLQIKAIKSFYHVIPFKSPQHTINTIKRAAHNEGINLIKRYTAGKRTRLTADGEGGFNSTLISLFYRNAGVGVDGNDGDEENHSLFKDNYDPEFANVEIRASFNHLMDTHGKHPRKRKALQLLAMQPDAEFSALAAKLYPDQVKKYHSTEEIFDRLGHIRFQRAICKLLKADKQDFNVFIGTLKKAM